MKSAEVSCNRCRGYLGHSSLQTVPTLRAGSVQSPRAGAAGESWVRLSACHKCMGIYNRTSQRRLRKLPALNSLQSRVDKVLGSNFRKEEGAEVGWRERARDREEDLKVSSRGKEELEADSKRKREGHWVQG